MRLQRTTNMNKTHIDYQVLPIPPIPNTQALSSTTFKPPPLDGSLNLPEICEWNARNNPEHPVFVYADGDGEEHEILWPRFVRAMRRVSTFVEGVISSCQSGHHTIPRTIGILASGGA